MNRLAAAPRRAADTLRMSFRARLLFALVGSVGLLLLATLLVVRVQTRRQVSVLVTRSVERANTAYREQEEARRRQLRGYAARFAGSNRLPAAMDEAATGAGAEFLGETALYELQLAGIPEALAAFGDMQGQPVAAVLDGRLEENAAAALPPTAARVATGPIEGVSSYHRIGDRLFSVQSVPLALFDAPVGSLSLGLPLDDAVATQLGRSVGAEVCFVAAGRCVAATPGARAGGRDRQMVSAVGTRGARRVAWDGDRVALVAEQVVRGEAGGDVWRVVAIPLEDVLRPFDQLERLQAAAGVIALLLALGLGAVLSRSFARPVLALVGATRRISAGDLETRVEVASRDELGTLADAFNEMAYGLMLKEQYRGVLDKVVSKEVADELLKGEIMLGGETREVTTLFADVRGFTSLTEGMPPQEVIAMLNELVGRMTSAVEAEGGVVDKFLGDGLMAIFGAPLSEPDDALRAVRAALRMRDAVAEANRERAARGDSTVEAGIGVNTGPAVAGNMGSKGRLNYTVLGESVNVSSRLCSAAGRGEILISQATLDQVQDHVEFTPAGERNLKGLSAPVPVFRVERLREKAAAPAAGAATVVALMLGLLAVPSGAQALPTLADAGVTWTSPNGFLQLTPSGRLELEAHLPDEERPWLVPGGAPVADARAILFLDLFAGTRWFASVGVRADRSRPLEDESASVRIEQAFLRWMPFGDDRLQLQGGQFVSPFGAYPGRHHTPSDPFIRPPLPYDHKTVLGAGNVPADAARLIAWRDAPEPHRAVGAPPVWAAPYPTGLMVSGRSGAVDARLAVVNSAPSSAEYWWTYHASREVAPSVIAGVGVQLSPEARFGASWNRGPYLTPGFTGTAGADFEAFDQELISFDASFTRGMVETRAEVLLDRWEVPNLNDHPRDVSFTVETKVKLSPALYAAGRYGAIRFLSIDDSGVTGEWDHDVDRLELGAGLKLGRTTDIRAEYLHLFTDSPEGEGDAFALRWTYAF